jgi:hypothetical protein
VKYWARVFGIMLMLSLGVVGKPSPTEKPAPMVPTVAVNWGGSGTNASAKTIETHAAEAETVTFPFVPPSIFIDVDPLVEIKARIPEGTARTRVTAPPPWASDEQRGIRKKNRG